MILRRTKHFIKNPSWMITKLMMRYCLNLVPDKQYMKYTREHTMDYPLDLDNPLTFSQKLQWLKLYDRNPLYKRVI